MRTIILWGTIVVSAFTTVLMEPVYAGQERGGGTEIERNFVENARQSLTNISTSIQSGEKYFDGFNVNAFQTALETTEVKEVKEICEITQDPNTGKVYKRCLDAHYYPAKNLIEFSTDAWKSKTCMEKMGIVLHEFGRASGNENGNYKYSSQVLFSKAFQEHCKDQSLQPSCNAKMPYLEQSLRALDNIDTSGLSDYVVVADNILRGWRRFYGKGCEAQTEAVCMNICFPKIGAVSFSLCGSR